MTKTTAKPRTTPAAKPALATLPKATPKKAAPRKRAVRAPLLAKALESSQMSTATEDLLTGGTPPSSAGELQHLALDVVYPAVDNPRTDLGDLTGLAASIAAVGVLEPILVRLSPRLTGDSGHIADYQIVAGHRRHAAAKLAGLDTIPCLVRSFTEQARIEAMVIENLQRQDLSPFDEARGLTQLVGVGLSQRDIAERVGCSQSHVSKRLSLAAMPAVAEELFVKESMTIAQVEELAKVPETDLPHVLDDILREVARAKDSLLPHWAIGSAIDGLKKKRKHDEAEQVGVASGLKRITDRPYDSPGGTHRVCKKADATHWYLYDRDTAIVWARTQAAHNKANPQPDVAPSRWAVEQEAATRIDDFLDSTILPAVTADVAQRAVFIASVTTMARARIELAWLRVPSLSDEACTTIGDDDPLFIAVALLCGLISVHWRPDVLEFFVAHGYRTTGVGETFPDGFDPTPILIVADSEPLQS